MRMISKCIKIDAICSGQMSYSTIKWHLYIRSAMKYISFLTREQGINSKENTVEPSCKSIDQNVSYTQVDYHVLCKTAK